MTVSEVEKHMDALIAMASASGQSLDVLVHLALAGDINILRAVSDSPSIRPR